MAVTVYQSTDASAPVLSGTAGALLGVLNACLINGYGSKSAAGWASAFSATNINVYRAATGNRFYLRVSDLTTDGRVICYETMTDASSGTNPTPTNAQVSGGGYWRKSSTADSTARPWIVIADETWFWLFIDGSSGGTGVSYWPQFFGDFTAYKSGGDAYSTLLTVNTTANNSGGAYHLATTIGVPPGTHFIVRGADGTTLSKAACKHSDRAISGSYPGGDANLPYPQPDGKLWLAPIYIAEDKSSVLANNRVRGEMPSVYAPCCYSVGNHLDTYTASGDVSGSMLIVHCYPSCQLHFKIG
jgi:hypothetical protein